MTYDVKTYLVIATVVAIIGVIRLAYNAGKDYRRDGDFTEVWICLDAMYIWLIISVLWLPVLILYIPFRIGYKGEKND